MKFAAFENKFHSLCVVENTIGTSREESAPLLNWIFNSVGHFFPKGRTDVFFMTK